MPRKTEPVREREDGLDAASMRPRPDAAENLPVRRMMLCPNGTASMRPRPDAAENLRPLSHPGAVADPLQ